MKVRVSMLKNSSSRRRKIARKIGKTATRKSPHSTAFGKWFAEVDNKEPLNLKGFAKHMTSHGKIADYQMCVLMFISDL